MKISVLASIVLMCGFAGPLGGCASTAPQRADSTTETMLAASARIDSGSAQIDAVLAATDGIVAAKGGDLRPAYKAFVAQVVKTETAAAAARKAADRMRASSNAHFDAWANEAQAINDAGLKEANLARRDMAKDEFALVTSGYDMAKSDYDTMISDLKDLRTALGADLTAAGVDAAA